MKYLFLLLIPFIFSCAKKEQEKVHLPSYSEKLFKEQEVTINLPQINNGEYFFEEDSILYLNVFLLNDSTIKFNDSVFRLKDTTTHYYYTRNVGGKDIRDFSPEAVAKSIEVYLKTTQNSPKKIEFNLFCDSSLSYKTLSAFYHNIFMLSLDNVKSINLFGENNKYVSVNYSKYIVPTHSVCFWQRNVLEILINYKGELSIENNWDLTNMDIKPYVIDFYNASLKNSSNPYLLEFNNRIIKKEIQYLKKKIEEGDSNKLEKLHEWEKFKNNVAFLGEYNVIPTNTIIFVELDKRNSYKTYLSVIDSITAGVNELKNQFCLDRYGKAYEELNTCLYIDYEVKKAIDNIFPNKINSPTYLIEEATPPPPPKR